MQQTTEAGHDPYSARVAAAKEMAQAVVDTCVRYEQAASPATINLLLEQVELLADLAEDLDVERTTKALERPVSNRGCPRTNDVRG